MAGEKIAVVAFGGNALIRENEPGHEEDQIRHAETLADSLLPFLTKGYRLLLVHGNGPFARSGGRDCIGNRFTPRGGPALGKVPSLPRRRGPQRANCVATVARFARASKLIKPAFGLIHFQSGRDGINNVGRDPRVL